MSATIAEVNGFLNIEGEFVETDPASYGPNPSSIEETPLSGDYPSAAKPVVMPMSNRLDKMTTEQACWAISNGAFLMKYLKESGGEVVEYPKTEPVEETDTLKYRAIIDILVQCELNILDDYNNVRPEHRKEWVQILQWALDVMPNGYEEKAAIAIANCHQGP